MEPNKQEAPRKRRQGAEKNRAILIEATLDCIAENGIARTSVSEIINRADLSRGMIHLHFSGKENLLVAAAQSASDGYFKNLDQLLKIKGKAPRHLLEALILSDLDEKVLNQRTVRIWYALRGEAQENPKIAQYSDTRDDRLRSFAYDALFEIVESKNPEEAEMAARDITHGLLALLEGMWTDYLLHPNAFSRETARRIPFRFLAALLPGHFDLEGALS